MAIPIAPHEKDLHEMDLTEFTDYWTGYTIMELGRGKGLRNAICLMLQNAMRISYERGIADGKSGKRGGA